MCGWHDLWESGGESGAEHRGEGVWVATRWPITLTCPVIPSRGQRTQPWFGLTDSCQSETGCPCPRACLISGQANHSHLDQLHQEKCTSALRMCNFETAGHASQEGPTECPRISVKCAYVICLFSTGLWLTLSVYYECGWERLEWFKGISLHGRVLLQHDFGQNASYDGLITVMLFWLFAPK